MALWWNNNDFYTHEWLSLYGLHSCYDTTAVTTPKAMKDK